MTHEELTAITGQVIGGRMEPEPFNQANGQLVYIQDKRYISDTEVKDIQRALLLEGIYSQLSSNIDDYKLRILAEFPRVKKNKPGINAALLVATIFTTMFTGALFVGLDPLDNFYNMFKGLPYAFAIMSILGAHEMGHYLYARKYRIQATLPYFIPFYLPGFSLFGTFGAFIKMKSPIPDKVALFDVGIAGPIAGFVLSILFLIIGFATLPDPQGLYEFITQMHPWSDTGAGALTLGDSLLFHFIRSAMGADYLPMYEAYHFPFIFAGWIGLLVTALNLMPIGQLDGGHISYALIGAKARFVAIGAFVLLAALNFVSTNWLVWTILIVFLIRFKHPPTLNDNIALDKNRQLLGGISYIIFITCFSPMPIYFG